MKLERTKDFRAYVEREKKAADVADRIKVEERNRSRSSGGKKKNTPILKASRTRFEEIANGVAKGILEAKTWLGEYEKKFEEAQRERLLSMGVHERGDELLRKERSESHEIEVAISDIMTDSLKKIKALRMDIVNEKGDAQTAKHKDMVAVYLLSLIDRLGKDLREILDRKSAEVAEEMEMDYFTLFKESSDHRDRIIDSFGSVTQANPDPVTFGQLNQEFGYDPDQDGENEEGDEEYRIPEETLRQEGVLIEKQFEGIKEQVRDIEKALNEIQNLQKVFAEHLSVQEDELRIIDENASAAVEYVEKGNEELMKSYDRSRSFSAGIAVFILVAGLCLLFLDWYG